MGFSKPRYSKDPPKLCQTELEILKQLKITDFKTPTPQDGWKNGIKILKLPRFAIVLH